jgi:hypothetical protein
MTAAAIEFEPGVANEPASPVKLVENRVVEDVRVERVVLRTAIVGALIGAAVCCPVYVALVWLALHNSGTSLAPPIGVAIGLGLYAGLFLGGSTGTLIGSKTLEHYEHETLPAAPPRQP